MLIFSLLLNMQSHPTWVRGLKHIYITLIQPLYWSHPTWVRGLKLTAGVEIAVNVGRTLRGCVD